MTVLQRTIAGLKQRKELQRLRIEDYIGKLIVTTGMGEFTLRDTNDCGILYWSEGEKKQLYTLRMRNRSYQIDDIPYIIEIEQTRYKPLESGATQ